MKLLLAMLAVGCPDRPRPPEGSGPQCADIWYPDADGDGFGDAAAEPVVACAAPVGQVADGTDCDDADPAVHPGAEETCDGADDDCDGAVDDGAGDPATFFRDQDGDGWGDDTFTTTGCAAPEGWAADDGDCDDADPLVHPEAAERCNLLDDDCDGAVDDGVLALAPAGAVAGLGECGGGEAAAVDPWSVSTLWTYSAPPDTEAWNVYSSPVLAHLDDDDGDGALGSGDAADVVVVAFEWSTESAWLVALDGRDGAQKWAIPGMHCESNLAVADVDMDGEPEVLAWDSDNRCGAWSAAGAREWTSVPGPHWNLEDHTLLATDLEGDGRPEVLADCMVLDGPTGALRFELAPPMLGHRAVSAGDLDLDGFQEILIGDTVCDHEGNLLWHSAAGAGWWGGAWSAALQADADPEAEVLIVADTWELYEHDGTLKEQFDLLPPDPLPSNPAIGDIDGDGGAEVVLPAWDHVLALELDGALLWSADFFDSTAFAAGPALYDLDGDGTLEVLYADMTTFRILDGATGAALYTDDSHESWTALETPVVGDLDGQGHAEIAVVRNEVSRHLGLSVVAYVHDPFQVGDGPDWRLSSTTWPLWGYAATNFSDDGAIPVAPTPPWSAHNSLRAGLPQVGPDDLPDLSLAITDLCVDDCAAGPAVVALQAANEGLADVPAGTAVALWADDCTGVRLVGETEAPALPAGTAAEGWAVAMPLSDLGACGLVATIDDKGHASGVVRECDELDNRATWPKPCP